MERGGHGGSYRGDGRRWEGKDFANPGGGDLLSMDSKFPIREGEMEVGDDLCWAKIGKGFNGRGGIPNKSDFLPIFKTRKLKR